MANLDKKYDVDDRVKAFEAHEAGILVSLAGPGTGKTYSFLQRIRFLTEQTDQDIGTITYLAFIKEIATAFIADFEEEPWVIKGKGAINPRVSTLHSFACRLIRNRGFTLGYGGTLYFTSFAQSGSMQSNIFIEDMLAIARSSDVNTPGKMFKAVNEIKVAWREDRDLQTLEEQIKYLIDPCLNLSLSLRVVDRDQTIPMAHMLFSDPNNRQDWITEINHYLVDEFQDFNIAEQHFISALATTAKSTVIVGDDNQSIYSGRGGSPKGIQELFHSEDVDTVTLLRSRRCRANILSKTNRFLKTINPTAAHLLPGDDGGEVSCYSFKSSKAEIAFLVDFLQKRIEELPANPRSRDGIVCLFPTKKLLQYYFNKLHDQVPSYIRGVEENKDRAWLTLALEMVLHPDQRFLERLVLQNYSEIKPRHRQEIVRYVVQHNISPVSAAESLLAEGKITGEAEQAAIEFLRVCQGLSSQNPDIISELVSQYLHLGVSGLPQRIESFIAAIGEVDQEESIRGICDSLLPRTALPAEDPKSILFLTMHSAKGLTKRTVVIPGLEDAWLPGQSEGEDAEEKARLFYVALTRATDTVLITYPRTRARGDPMNYPTPGRGQSSRFIQASGIGVTFYK